MGAGGGWGGSSSETGRQAGRLSSGFRGQLARSSLLGSHRRGFLYAHLLQTAPPLLYISGSRVYLFPSPPPGSMRLPRPFPRRSQVQKIQKHPKKRLRSAGIKCFFLSACARVRKRPVVIRGDTERRGLSGG